jgi:hypothetical protein
MKAILAYIPGKLPISIFHDIAINKRMITETHA